MANCSSWCRLPIRKRLQRKYSKILFLRKFRLRQADSVEKSRKIVKITEVTGREGNQILLQDIFTFEQTGLDSHGKVQGYHTATGNIPVFIDELRKSGRLNLDMSVFVPKN